ncbi:MAG: hypothetical protein FJ029_00310 [Actinobacteria bacterium]|nr:hypothetical protein [Actinomycetota bacterium]
MPFGLRVLRARAGLVLVAVFLSACGSAPVGLPAANPTPDRLTTPATPCGPPTCQTIPVTLNDFTIVSPAIVARPGSIRFVLKNEGSYTHAFQIQSRENIPTSPMIGSGQTGYLDAQLAAGTYEAVCPIPGHTVRGQRATVTVG